MPRIMDPNLLHATQLDAAPHFVLQETLGHGKQPVILLIHVQALDIILNILCQEGWDADDAITFRRLGRGDNIFAVQPLAGLVDGDCPSSQVNIIEGQRQQFANAHSCPEQDLERKPG